MTPDDESWLDTGIPTISLEAPGDTTDAEDVTVGERPGARVAEARQRRASPGRYRLLDSIGRGGMGEVLVARDNNIGREVAVKRMLSTEPSSVATNRFLREARVQGRLDHPAIPPVYELARDRDGRPYFVMKRLRGTTLRDILDGKDPELAARYPRSRLLRAVAEVCLAIELAHSRGVIHRDLKPANIMLGDFGEVYVLDWGVARVIGETDIDSVGDPVVTNNMTSPGAVIGTPGYMAPEQLAGADIDRRIDVYALGCILFEILAGSSLHPQSRHRTVDTIDARPSRRASDREIAPELDALCAAATAHDPHDRIATPRALGEAIQRYLDGDRDLERRRALARDRFSAAANALEAHTDDGRRTAMREAARALALDPTLTDAADLVGRLMLEPPTHTPIEVEQTIAAEARETSRRYARVGLLGYLGYLLFVFEFLWVGVMDWRYVLAFLGVLGLNIGFAWVRTRTESKHRYYWIAIAANALLIAVVARIFTPLIIGPGVAAATVMAMIPNPAIRSPRLAGVVTIVMMIAVLVPWLAEYAGVFSRTMWTENGFLLVHSPALEMHGFAVQFGLTVYSIMLIAFSGMMAFTAARGERIARHRLHLQAWQLRQLMPI